MSKTVLDHLTRRLFDKDYCPYRMKHDHINATVLKRGIATTFVVIMPPFQEQRSLSHPIAVTLGKTSISKSQRPQLPRDSATLSLGTSILR